MNREETKQAIKVMQAYVDGAEIEYSARTIPGVGHGVVWGSHDHGPNFDWHHYEYRIKPVPCEGWVEKYRIHAHIDGVCDKFDCIHMREVDE